ncbi:nascent polypeptide-associated complex protein [Candidatus Woesearchaeota archaeon]|nr:nascent polypeptide-associated complex protein [Candidatus Woesearchaeota archaeon]
MFPGMNPRKMQQMMKQLGVKQEEISAEEVIIKTKNKELVFSNPQVTKVNMMGQDTFQLVGNFIERQISSIPQIDEDDINTVAEQANVSTEKAKESLKKHKGDIAAAILDFHE